MHDCLDDSIPEVDESNSVKNYAAKDVFVRKKFPEAWIFEADWGTIQTIYNFAGIT